MRRVKIKLLPKDLPQAGKGYETNAKSWNGAQANRPTMMDQFSLKDTKANQTLQPVDREDANLEAEKGETAIINQGGIPAKFNIGGKRHSEGGTPLNLPNNSFIFSDTKAMRIKDPTILAQFGITSGVVTPADISKKYNLNNYRAMLADVDSTDLQRSTAEMMIANYNNKLAKLALVQESKKGFPQGIPAIAMPYIEAMGIKPDDLTVTQSQPNQPASDMPSAKFGGGLFAKHMDAFRGYYQQGATTKTVDPYSEAEIINKVKAKEEHDAFVKSMSNRTNWWGLPEGSPKLAKSLAEYQKEERDKNLDKMKKQDAEFKAKDSRDRQDLSIKGLDTQIETTIELMKLKESDALPLMHTARLTSLTFDQKALAELYKYRAKLKSNIDKYGKKEAYYYPRITTQDEYEDSLLKPYTKARKDAQTEWINNSGKYVPLKQLNLKKNKDQEASIAMQKEMSKVVDPLDPNNLIVTPTDEWEQYKEK